MSDHSDSSLLEPSALIADFSGFFKRLESLPYEELRAIQDEKVGITA